MSILTIFWSVAAGICLTIASFSLLNWLRGRDTLAHLFFSITAFAAAFFTVTDMIYFTSDIIAGHLTAIRWANLAVYGILIGLVWFLYYYFETARL